MITTYRISDIDNWEEFVNKLFSGLKTYEQRNLRFKFKITFRDKNIIELKTLNLGVHAN